MTPITTLSKRAKLSGIYLEQYKIFLDRYKNILKISEYSERKSEFHPELKPKTGHEEQWEKDRLYLTENANIVTTVNRHFNIRELVIRIGSELTGHGSFDIVTCINYVLHGNQFMHIAGGGINPEDVLDALMRTSTTADFIYAYHIEEASGLSGKLADFFGLPSRVISKMRIWQNTTSQKVSNGVFATFILGVLGSLFASFIYPFIS